MSHEVRWNSNSISTVRLTRNSESTQGCVAVSQHCWVSRKPYFCISHYITACFGSTLSSTQINLHWLQSVSSVFNSSLPNSVQTNHHRVCPHSWMLMNSDVSSVTFPNLLRTSTNHHLRKLFSCLTTILQVVPSYWSSFFQVRSHRKSFTNETSTIWFLIHLVSSCGSRFTIINHQPKQKKKHRRRWNPQSFIASVIQGFHTSGAKCRVATAPLLPTWPR